MNKIILASHLDFQSPFGQYTLGWAYLTAGKMSDARREFEVILERNVPAAGIYGPAASHYFLGIVALRMGQPDRARAEAQELKRLAEAQGQPDFRAWHEDLVAIIQASRKSVAELGERPPKRPRLLLARLVGLDGGYPRRHPAGIAGGKGIDLLHRPYLATILGITVIPPERGIVHARNALKNLSRDY